MPVVVVAGVCAPTLSTVSNAVDTWHEWNGTYTCSCTVTLGALLTGTTSSVIWQRWNSSPTVTITSTTSDAIWTEWVTVGSSASITASGRGLRQETPEEITARELRNKLFAETRAKEQAEATRARGRARKLLVDHLNLQQREDYEKQSFFYLFTNKGKKFRIDQGTHGNVKLVDVTTNEVLGSYCSQPTGVPTEDAMLAQKLYLEIDEDEFVRHANFTPNRNARRAA